MRQRRDVYIGLGSNLGDREQNLEGALAALEREGVHITARSSYYLTEPVGGPEQDWYLNAVVAGETALSPEALLALCLAIEREFGRERRVRNGPRTLDLDVLLYDDEAVDTGSLQVPHPRLHERRFVLQPLAELAGDRVHPRLGRSVRELLDECGDRSRVLLHEPRALQS